MKREINSHLLNYTIQGEGQAVLLLHGFMESLHIWDELALELSEKNQVITLDLPGHGQSDDLRSDISIDHMASLIQSFLLSLGIEKIAIIGHSMGGYVALAFAALFPHNIDSLCLFHSMASSDNEEAKINRDRKINLMSTHPHILIEESISSLFWEERRIEFKKEISVLSQIAKNRNPMGYIQALQAMKNRPDRNYILESGIPLFYIAGKHDPIIPLAKSLKEAEKIKTGSLAVLPNSGHMGFIEEKIASSELIYTFLLQEFIHH